MLVIYLLFGIFLGTINPPITNSAVSGMPASLAGVAASLASAGRQTGTTPGAAISGTIAGSALARGGMAFTRAEHGVWRIVVGLGLVIFILGLITTSRWALGSARPPCSTAARRGRPAQRRAKRKTARSPNTTKIAAAQASDSPT